MAVGLVVGVRGTAAPAAAAAVALPNPRSTRSGRPRAPASSTGPPRVAHGSGFLAVFVAGILLGDAKVPRRDEIARFHSALAEPR